MKKALIPVTLALIATVIFLNPELHKLFLAAFSILCATIIVLYPALIFVSIMLLTVNIFYKKNIIARLAQILYSLFYMGFLIIHTAGIDVLYKTGHYKFFIFKSIVAIILGVILVFSVWKRKKFFPVLPLISLFLYLIGIFLGYYLT